MPRKIIIDTDPGQDDAVAILLALASPEDFDVLGVVAVAGNVGLHHSATNARKIVELAGRPEVPVYAGCARPMRRTLVTAEHVHGDTGLNGPDLPAPKIELQPQHGVDYIIDTLMNAEPKTITLCTLGPLTNIGMALVKEPKIAERVAEIVMMGGAYFEVGNITPAAEFNIYVDPEAADIVFRSGIKITVLPLDVTHQIQSTPPALTPSRRSATAPARPSTICSASRKVLISRNTAGKAPRCMTLRSSPTSSTPPCSKAENAT